MPKPTVLTFVPPDIRKPTTFHVVNFEVPETNLLPPQHERKILKTIGKQVGEEVAKALQSAQEEAAKLFQQQNETPIHLYEANLQQIESEIKKLEQEIQNIETILAAIQKNITEILHQLSALTTNAKTEKIAELLELGKEYCLELEETEKKLQALLERKIDLIAKRKTQQDLTSSYQSIVAEIETRRRFIHELPSIIQDILSGKIPFDQLK